MYKAAEIGLIQTVNSGMGEVPVFDHIMFALTYIDLFKNGVLILIYYWLWFRQGGQQRANREKLATAIVASGFVVVFSRGLSSLLPHVDRPAYVPEFQLAIPEYFDVSALNNWSSIISDHASLAFALSVGIFSVSRGLGIFAMFWSLCAICFPRVYFGLHYPSDILEGALIGILLTSLAIYVKGVRRMISHPLLSWEKRHPSSFYTVTFFISYELIERLDEVIKLAKLVLQ